MASIPPGKLRQVMRVFESSPSARERGVHWNEILAGMSGTHAVIVRRYLEHLMITGAVQRVGAGSRFRLRASVG